MPRRDRVNPPPTAGSAWLRANAGGLIPRASCHQWLQVTDASGVAALAHTQCPAGYAPRSRVSTHSRSIGLFTPNAPRCTTGRQVIAIKVIARRDWTCRPRKYAGPPRRAQVDRSHVPNLTSRWSVRNVVQPDPNVTEQPPQPNLLSGSS